MTDGRAAKEVRGLLRGLDVDLRGNDFSQKVWCGHCVVFAIQKKASLMLLRQEWLSNLRLLRIRFLIYLHPWQRRIQLVEAIIECHKDKCLRAVNGIEVTNAQESSLRDCVHRNGGIDEEVRF